MPHVSSYIVWGQIVLLFRTSCFFSHLIILFYFDYSLPFDRSITNGTTQEEIATLTSHLEYCIAHNPSALAGERYLHRFVQYCSAEAVRAVLKDNNFVMKVCTIAVSI